MELSRITVIEQEIWMHAGRAVAPPARRVAACGLLRNPFSGTPARDDHDALAELSVEAGEVLTEATLKRLDATPAAYGKAAVVGVNGDLEHAAAMIHVRLGLAMRRGIGTGRALIPGNAKVGGPGTPVDLVFGGIDEGWDYDAMDTMTVVVPEGPGPDEILLIVGFATGRPNARIRGASQDQVADLVGRLTG